MEPLPNASASTPDSLIEIEPSEMTATDRCITELVDLYLGRGRDIKRWWDQQRPGDLQDKFEVAFTYNRPDVAYGFFDCAPVGGQEMPILGVYQTQFYDQPKAPSGDKAEAASFLNRQMREFVLRYFMRVSDFREPQPFTRGTPTPPPILRPLSMCPSSDPTLQGFGYSQLYYKRKGTQEIGKFPANQRDRILDLRKIAKNFEWVVLKVRIFDFSFSYQPFGPSGPSFTLPLEEDSLLIVAPDFITATRRRKKEMLGTYGFGYAFIKNPGPSLLGWGPGEFDAAFQSIDFSVNEAGKTRVDMLFIANRPTSIINFPLNPLELALKPLELTNKVATSMNFGGLSSMTNKVTGMLDKLPFASPSLDPVLGSIALANIMTGGLASRELCISREQLEKDLLLKHFSQHYNTIVGSLETWRQFSNWLDPASLPEWVRSGRSV